MEKRHILILGSESLFPQIALILARLNVPEDDVLIVDIHHLPEEVDQYLKQPVDAIMADSINGKRKLHTEGVQVSIDQTRLMMQARPPISEVIITHDPYPKTARNIKFQQRGVMPNKYRSKHQGRR